MHELGLNPTTLARAAGLGQTAVRDALEGHSRSPRMDTIAAIATVLGMTLSEIYDGESASYQRIPVAGAVAAGEGWTAYDDVLGEVAMHVEGGEPTALEVKGDSMAPVYRDGDVLIGAKRSGASADNLIGLDCIVLTETGERYVKFLARGTVRGRFNLRSYNPTHPDIQNVRLQWVAPIIWVRRGQR